MDAISASIYELPEPARSMSVRDLWRSICADVKAECPDGYVELEGAALRIGVLSQRQVSPDGKIVRYRTVEAAIRRKPAQGTLLDLCGGNLFSLATTQPPVPIHIGDDPRYAQWARRCGQIPLAAHLGLIQQFIADLQDAGWLLQRARLKGLTLPLPQVRNARGVASLEPSRIRALARSPLRIQQGDFGVVGSDIGAVGQAAERLKQAYGKLFPAAPSPVTRLLRRPAPSLTNLVLLDDHTDLNEAPQLRAVLSEAERSGVRFKLAKQGSLSKDFPAQNIAYDLFLLAGGLPWAPAQEQPAFCSVDAGHDRERNRSRWVKVETDPGHRQVGVFTTDTRLAEQIPAELADRMWPATPGAIFCRDGRLAQEKTQYLERAQRGGHPLIEAKKAPRAILWRADPSGMAAAHFGDAVVDAHDDLLIQTAAQNPGDYVHPLRLTIWHEARERIAAAFLQQHTLPALSLFQLPRLPGPLYFADLVSKLTGDGWTRIIGRGFNLSHVIPQGSSRDA